MSGIGAGAVKAQEADFPKIPPLNPPSTLIV